MFIKIGFARERKEVDYEGYKAPVYNLLKADDGKLYTQYSEGYSINGPFEEEDLEIYE